MQHKLDDGRTVVEHFVGAHPELSEDDRAVMLGWQDVVEGIFEIEERDGEALVAVNLSDDLTYRIRSNTGASLFDRMPERSFLAGRVVPVTDEWVLSGACRPMPASRRSEIYEMVMRSFVTDKASVFRNKEKLELGWKLQREDREYFLSFFGTDEVVMTGAEYAERMPEYWDFRIAKAQETARMRAANHAPAPEYELSNALCAAKSVGVVYYEVEGLLLLDGYATVKAVFDDPALIRDRTHRNRVSLYLKDDSIPPAVFRRLADRDPSKADQVFRHLLNKPRFSWERDGEPLLRRTKRAHFERPAYPSVTPASERLTTYLRG
ncbi:hypothetical protein V1227_21635 [Lentzea sp. DG1S-22]|uniref:hypothetical protein n=1 Tax=Lentzea sp. DG1S-22 TaxID=3108822 RepID=UPI002E760AF9|nr:hypothetical protein [Lentzea sp. DG1S-22]WVH77712.1 hypothetical protein V1227_21635 [Lentzea sp. DG1S-22]